MLTRRLLGHALVFACAVASLGASCGQRAVTLMPGIINNPANRSLRRAIFGFAVDRICGETRSRSLPLRMNEGEPSTGRFFPSACAVNELPNENLYVQFVGHGYAWTNVTGRVGFEASASVEYAHDFLVEGSSMVVYFREAKTTASSWKPVLLERRDGGVAGGALELLGRDPGGVVTQGGQRILEGQLARGFTVVRDGDGAVSFSMGLMKKGERPPVPFDTRNARHPVVANDRTELHAGQRDYLGPFTLDGDGRALVVTAVVEGAPSVDVLVVASATGETWLAQYERYAETGPAPGPTLYDDTVPAVAAYAATTPGAPPVTPPPWRRAFPLPAGSYYVVLDHSATAGRSAPPASRGDDRAALVSYAIELGEAR